MEVIDVTLTGVTLLAAGTLLVVAVVEMIKALMPEDGQKRNWRTFAIILGSGLVGTLIAPSLGVDWLMGTYVGLSASGLVKIVK